MADIGLFFGSDEGNTELVAEKIQSCIGVDCVDLYDIADVTQLEFDQYNTIILGIPTWDFGQIQSDWEEFWSDLENINFTGKTVALFGLGDQFGYGDFFLDAMGDLYQVITQAGAKVVGFWSTEGYEFEASKPGCKSKAVLSAWPSMRTSKKSLPTVVLINGASKFVPSLG